MELNYYRTLIAVADDCYLERSVIPTARGTRPTVAVIQHELLAGAPYAYTQEDVLFTSWLIRQELPGLTPEETVRLRADFFARPQPCLRASPLPKKYGFGLLFDADGRVALCPVESPEYQRIIAAAGDGDVKILKAFRSKRA